MAVSLVGWEQFFNKLEASICACEIQSRSVIKGLTEYALKRLQTGIRSVSSIVDNIGNATSEHSQVCLEF